MDFHTIITAGKKKKGRKEKSKEGERDGQHSKTASSLN